MVKMCFPWFGGKSKITDIVWKRFGNVPNYVEPFAGSLAVLLANPNPSKIETVNDINCFLSNFYRAISAVPDEVAKYADYPVNEADLHARHKWLVSDATSEFKTKMHSDPDYFDVKIAGWWVWGISSSIGTSWLDTKGLNSLPVLSSAGQGIHGLTHNVYDWFNELQKRLSRVRVACGDWKRIMTPSITYNNKGISKKDITAIFLDPPYDLSNRDKVYSDDSNIFNEVCEWAIANGDNERLRVAVCGYEGDGHFPNTWETLSWKANGGFGNAGEERGRGNAFKERVYFSPHCLKVKL